MSYAGRYGFRRYAAGTTTLYDQAFKAVREAEKLEATGNADAKKLAIQKYEYALRWANESHASGAHDLRVKCREGIVRLGGTLPE